MNKLLFFPHTGSFSHICYSSIIHGYRSIQTMDNSDHQTQNLHIHTVLDSDPLNSDPSLFRSSLHNPPPLPYSCRPLLIQTPIGSEFFGNVNDT